MLPIDLQADDNGDDSIRASLTAAMDETPTDTTSTERADRPAETPPDPAPDAATPDTSQGQAAASPPSEGRARGPDGKFLPKTEAAPDKAAPVMAKPNDPSTDAKPQASAEASKPIVAPPAGWTAAEKAEWSKLPPAVQAAVSRREAEIDRGGRQWSDEKRRYEAMIAPVAESARLRGMDVGQGLQTLMAAQRALDTDPVNAIRHIAQSYGVDLATLAGTQSPQGSPEAPQPVRPQILRDPRVDALWQAQQAQTEMQKQESVDFVTTFAQSAGHEHFDAVQDELMALIPAIKAQNPSWGREKVLQEAYDRSTFANPTVRAAITAEREAAAEAKRVADASARAQAARKAGSSVSGAAPAGTPATGARDSLRADLEAAFAGA